MTTMIEIFKRLSKNDLGLTGSHQAGTVIPKSESFLSFFPHLHPLEENPRIVLEVSQKDAKNIYRLVFVYYNSKLRGTGTRNEYRLTGLTKFFRDSSAKPGDFIVISRDISGSYSIGLEPELDNLETQKKQTWEVRRGSENE